MNKVKMLAVVNVLVNRDKATLLKSISVVLPADAYRRAFPLSRRLLDAEIALVSRVMSFVGIFIENVPGTDEEDE